MSPETVVQTPVRPFDFPRRRPRVLHLVRPDPHLLESGPLTPVPAHGGDGLLLACRALVQGDQGSHHTVAALGGVAARARCETLGLNVHHTLPLANPIAGGLSWLASHRLRSLIRVSGPFDVLLCWGRDLIPLADAATRSLLPTPTLLCWPPPARVGESLPVPAVVPVMHESREAMRAELGLVPSDRVCLLLSDPPTHGDANGLVYVLGLLENAREPFIAMAHVQSSSMPRARGVVRAIGLRTRVIQTDVQLVNALPACDVALVLPSAAFRGGARRELADHPLPNLASQRVLAASALSLGLPVVVPRGVGMDDLFSDSGAAGLIHSYRNAHMARAMLAVCPSDGTSPSHTQDLRGPGIVTPAEFAAGIAREWIACR